MNFLSNILKTGRTCLHNRNLLSLTIKLSLNTLIYTVLLSPQIESEMMFSAIESNRKLKILIDFSKLMINLKYKMKHSATNWKMKIIRIISSNQESYRIVRYLRVKIFRKKIILNCVKSSTSSRISINPTFQKPKHFSYKNRCKFWQASRLSSKKKLK